MLAAAPAGTASYADGQDMGELFAIYEAPSQGLGLLKQAPVPTKQLIQRRKVHAEGLWHKAIHVWLYNDKGMLVLQKRSQHKDTFPGFWDVSVGGHLTAEDDSLTTAVKETAEELGVSVDAAQFEQLFTIATEAEGDTPKHGTFTDREYKDVYLLRYNGALTDLKYADGEVEELKLEYWRDVKQKLLNREANYIPRSRDYIDNLFDAVQSRVSLQ